MQRREFLSAGLSMTVATDWLAAICEAANAARPPRILLRSSWQVVNIGDIAHTPGVLALIDRHLPHAEVILWASGDLTAEVAAMEHRRFPNLRIVKGRIGEDGRASNAELGEAVAWADFLLHGSGPSLVAAGDVAAWVKHTGKPFGVYGITYGSFFDADRTELLSQAQFVYFRDSVSLAHAREQGVKSSIMEFGPDGAFACDLRNDDRATEFLQAHDLTEGQFLCCLSRLRYTPYWTIPGKRRPVDPEREKRNAEMQEQDHKALREAIIAVVREAGLKVLLCPEDMTQMAVGKAMFYDRLPADVRPRVVWRENFWLTDEALSTYVRSAGLFGSEMHSPIMAIGNGVPAIVCRFEEQTSKGFMWRDIGLGDWLFDLDQPEDHAKIVPAVLEIAINRDAALQKAKEARALIEQRQRLTMAELQRCVTKAAADEA
ncbi:MAG: polysaccharide pyruvyl transferase family protein [Planctomycetaceae bacterium]